MTKKEKWKVEPYRGEKGRIVVDQDNVLIADCYADCDCSLGVPEDYEKLAKRIALLPEMERALRKVYDSIPWYHPSHTRCAVILDKLDKLKT
jgi:hypothetical protein